METLTIELNRRSTCFILTTVPYPGSVTRFRPANSVEETALDVMIRTDMAGNEGVLADLGGTGRVEGRRSLRQALLREAQQRMQSLRGNGAVAALSPTPDDFVLELAAALSGVLEPGEAVAELGCGDARILHAVCSTRPGHYLGIDMDPSRLSLARLRCPQLELVCCDIFSFAYEEISAFVLFLSKEGNRAVFDRILRRRNDPIKVLAVGVRALASLPPKH